MASQMGDPLATHAAARPDKAALIYEERTVTFAQLDERANRYAAAMRRLGVEAGDRITGISYNSVEGNEAAHGARRIGAVGVPINYHLRPAEVAYIVNDSGATVVPASPDFIAVVEEAKSQIEGDRHYLLTGPGSPPPGPTRPLSSTRSARSPSPSSTSAPTVTRPR